MGAEVILGVQRAFVAPQPPFARLFQEKAAGIAIIDLGRIGGITTWRRVAALAQAHHVPVCGHVLPEVHVHLLASIPNGYLVEYVPRSAGILQSMPALEDGCLVAPQSPGFGPGPGCGRVAPLQRALMRKGTGSYFPLRRGSSEETHLSKLCASS